MQHELFVCLWLEQKIRLSSLYSDSNHCVYSMVSVCFSSSTANALSGGLPVSANQERETDYQDEFYSIPVS